MKYLASLDSSRDLQHICAKSFVNRFHLVIQISKILLQKNFAKRTKHGLSFEGEDVVGVSWRGKYKILDSGVQGVWYGVYC